MSIDDEGNAPPADREAAVRSHRKFNEFYSNTNSLLSYVVLVLSLAAAAGIAHLIETWNAPVWLYTVVGVTVFVGMLVGCFILMLKLLPPWLPTLQYVRHHLQTPISMADARVLHFLFSGALNGRWYPMTGLLSVPREQRRRLLFEFAAAVTHGQQEADSSAQAQRSHVGGTDDYVACCSLLGVAPTATYADIHRAYRARMKQYHPDMFARAAPDVRRLAEERAKLLNEAYAKLESAWDSSPEK
jgi:hypothetical protein